jgi:hypothetical protein
MAPFRWQWTTRSRTHVAFGRDDAEWNVPSIELMSEWLL